MSDLKFGPFQAEEMAKRRAAGASYKLIARDFETNEDRVKKYVRAWTLFGASFWTDDPVRQK